jgi:hypothetical protein
MHIVSFAFLVVRYLATIINAAGLVVFVETTSLYVLFTLALFFSGCSAEMYELLP